MKRFLLIVISVLLAMSTLSLGVFADDDESSTTTTTAPSVTIMNPTVSSQSINAGDSFNISFSIGSNCTVTTEYTYGSYSYVTWDGNSQTKVTVSGTGFSFESYLAEQDVKSGINTVTVLSDSSLETGRYQVTLTVTTTSASGSVASDSRTFNIDIESSEVDIEDENNNADFVLSGASIPEGKGKSNLSTNLTLEFKNTSSYQASDVKVTLSSLGGLVLNTYTDTVQCGDVSGGESITAAFPIVFPEYPSAQHTLEATVTYTDLHGAEQSETYNIYIRATEKATETETTDTKSLEPKVIVSNYTIDNDAIASGEEFTLTFVLKNTSHDKSILNMTVDVQTAHDSTSSSSSTSVFSAIDGTTSFYTEQIPTNGEMEYSIKLRASAAAGAGTYPITISYDFEYDNGSGYSASNNSITINLQVSQAIKFELMEWEPPTECYGSSGCSIYFQYFNKSKTSMTSLTIGVAGDFYMETEYVGTLNASSYDYFSGYISPSVDYEVGDTLTAVLTFTFEDDSGAEHTLEYPFEVLMCEEEIYDWDYSDSYYDDEFMYDEYPVDADYSGDGTALSLPTKIAIGVGAAVVVIVIIAIIVVIVKKRKHARLLEGLDDENNSDE